MSRNPSDRFGEIATLEAPTDCRVVIDRAIVMGGGFAGLLAARVLSDHAEEVLITERDEIASASTGEPRPGVFQSTQHVLLDAGRVQPDRWFPGFSDELITAGAVLHRGESIQMYVNVCLR